MNNLLKWELDWIDKNVHRYSHDADIQEIKYRITRRYVRKESEPDNRILDLANRLIASGPKCRALSASECHELSDFILELRLS